MTDNVERSLGRLEGKVDMILAGLKVQTDTTESHDVRLTKLEGWKATVLGGAAVLGVIGGWLAKVLL